MAAKPQTIDEYFAKTEQPGQLERFEAARYKSPYLKQAIIRKQDDPISSQVRYWETESRRTATEAMQPVRQAAKSRTSPGTGVCARWKRSAIAQFAFGRKGVRRRETPEAGSSGHLSSSRGGLAPCQCWPHQQGSAARDESDRDLPNCQARRTRRALSGM